MTREELVALLAERWSGGFADREAAQVRAVQTHDAVAQLYALAAHPPAELPAARRHAVAWRAAYVLERIFFCDREAFDPVAADFCRAGFPSCTDPSVRRHFGKIMAHLLVGYDPGAEVLDAVAERAAEWTVDPKTRPAVRVWTLEVLRLCRGRVEWVDDVWDDLVATLAESPSPAVAVRLRRLRG